MRETRTTQGTTWRGLAALLAFVALGPWMLTLTAQAGPTVGLVGQTATRTTPHVTTDTAGVQGTVHELAVAGGVAYAAGHIGRVLSPDRSVAYVRSHFVAWDLATGAVRAFAPSFDAQTRAVVIGCAGACLYVGGDFTKVNGIAARGLVKIDVATGKVDPAFTPTLNGPVTALALAVGSLLVGGTFTTVRGAPRVGFAAVDLASGAPTGAEAVTLEGRTPGTGSLVLGPTQVRKIVVSPDGTLAIVLGNFERIRDDTNGAWSTRRQIAMLSLSPSLARLHRWWDAVWAKLCYVPAYTRDADWSPDGKAFVVVTTGGANGPPTYCDAAVKYVWPSPYDGAPPVWANYTGEDTLLSVAYTSGAIYVGGHQRWLNTLVYRNGLLVTSTQVAAPGLGALHPTLGTAPAWWAPVRDPRGQGATELLATSTGLFVGGDHRRLGCRTPGLTGCIGQVLDAHAGIGFLPAPS